VKKVFLSHAADKESREIVRYLIHSLSEYRFEVITLDHWMPGEQPIREAVQDAIKQCSIVIALITRPSSNIFYEIGYAEGIGKKIVILAESESVVPFDLKTMRMVSFDRFDSSFVHRLLRILEEERPNELDDDKLEAALRDNPEAIFELYQNHRGSFERVDNRTFEEIVYRLFEKRGYHVQAQRDSSSASFDFEVKDFGRNKRVIVEVKKYNASGKISVGQVQQLLGAVVAEKADSGILIAPSEFTRTAVDFAGRCLPHVELWNLEELQKCLGFPPAKSFKK